MYEATNCEVCTKGFKSNRRLEQHLATHNLNMDAEYKCQVCKMTFQFEGSFESHMLYHNQYNSPINLTKRTESQDDNVIIIDDEESDPEDSATYAKEPEHVCSICGKGFASRLDFSLHMSAHSKTWLYTCHICDMRFQSEEQLNKHTVSHRQEQHQAGSISEEGFIENSNLSLQQSPENRKLDSHQLTRDKDLPSTKSSPEPQQRLEVKRTYTCGICTKVFQNEGYFRKHMEEHITDEINRSTGNMAINVDDNDNVIDDTVLPNEDRSYDCDICGQQFQLQTLLAQHMPSHSNGLPVKSNITESNVASSTPSAPHLVSHIQENPTTTEKVATENQVHKCTTCGKCLKSATSLKQHLLSHSTIRQHVCNVCDAAFKLKYTLVVHMRIHNGQWPHVCKFCNKGFNDRFRLSKHLNMYHFGQSLSCSVCEKQFKYKSGLVFHARFCKGKKVKNECNVCGKVYAYRKHLVIHMRMHESQGTVENNAVNHTSNGTENADVQSKLHSRPTFECSVCGKIFKHKGYFKKHIEGHPDYETHDAATPQSGENHGTVLSSDALSQSEESSSILTQHPETQAETGNVNELDLKSKDNFEPGMSTHPDECASTDGETVAQRELPLHPIYICGICAKIFKHKGYFKKHMEAHNANNSNQDDVRKESDTSDVNTETHTAYHSHKCNYCGKGFESLSFLAQHLAFNCEKHSNANNIHAKDMTTTTDPNPMEKSDTEDTISPAEKRTNVDKQRHKCNKCGKHFGSRSLLNQHFVSHSVKRRHKCDTCEKSFKHRHHLIVHLRIHNGNWPYVCKVCNKGYNDRLRLARHMKTQHSGTSQLLVDKRPHVRTQESQQPLAGDMKEGNSEQKAGTVAQLKKHFRRRLKCDRCGRIFKHRGYFQKHIKGHSDDDTSKRSQTGSGENPELVVPCSVPLNDKNHHNSSSPGKSFQSPFPSARHEISHSEQQSRKSSVSEMDVDPTAHPTLQKNSITEPDSCASKEQTLDGKHNLKCEKCGRVFKYRSLLNRHLLSHSLKKRHKCELCGKTCKTKQSLSVHMRVHNGKWPYRCSVCNKGFHHKIQMDKHASIHETAQSRTCPVCKKHFKYKGKLLFHMRVHTGHHPKHECHLCGQVYTFKNHLTYHMRSHARNEPAEQRPQNLTEKTEAVSQKKSHPTFKCSICAKIFKHRGYFKKHMEAHIANESDEEGQQAVGNDVADPNSKEETEATHQRAIHSPPSYKCGVCSQIFKHRGYFKRHMDSHIANESDNEGTSKENDGHAGEKSQETIPINEECPYRCDDCLQSFKFPSLLAEHWRSCSGKPPKKMDSETKMQSPLQSKSHLLDKDVDQKQNSKYPLANKHFRKGHYKRKPTNLKSLNRSHGNENLHHECSKCEKRFKYKSQLTQHFMSHSGHRPYKCSMCKNTFKQKWHLYRHLKLLHGEESTLVEERSVNQELIHECDRCGKTFKSEKRLCKHLKSHHGESSHQCTICEKDFKTDTELTLHMKSHSQAHGGTASKPYKCNVCGKQFKGKGYLSVHMILHKVQESSKCKICKKTFKNKGMKKHMYMMHNAKQTHDCQICGKRYMFKAKLLRHMKVHKTWAPSGGRPYQCHICKKGFKTPTHLSLHELIHSELRPHKCTICNSAFRQKAHLKRHSMVHIGHRPYACTVCSASFDLEYHLRKHMEVHPKEAKKQSSTYNESANEATTLTNQMNTDAGKEDEFPERHMSSSVEVNHVSGKMDERDSVEAFKEPEASMEKESVGENTPVSHLKELPYKCRLCGKGFKLQMHLGRHMKGHANRKTDKSNQLLSEDTERHDASVCLSSFNSVSEHSNEKDLRETKHHFDEQDNFRTKFKCDRCGRIFKHRGYFKKHIKGHNDDDASKCSQTGSGENPELVVPCTVPLIDKKHHNSSSPGKSFQSPFPSAQHEISHSGHQSHESGVGEIDINDIDNFTLDDKEITYHSLNHMAEHAGEKKPIEAENNPEVHIREVQKEEKDLVVSATEVHVCNICGKDFNWTVTLLAHMQSHK